jgi:hypothetical protein
MIYILRMMMMDEPHCNMCGYCCHFFANGEIRKCKHLVTQSNGRTLCRIYPRRLGVIVYKSETDTFRCHKMEEETC